MNNISRYLKIARDAVIKPSGNIEDKIISRISNINREDKSLLDENFLDFFKKTNSRLYLIYEKIKNNRGAFIAIAIAVIIIAIFFIFLINIFIDRRETGGGNTGLSSSKNKAQKN